MSAPEPFSKDSLKPGLFFWVVGPVHYEIYWAGERLPANLYCTEIESASTECLGPFPTQFIAAEAAVEHAKEHGYS